jgi:hypothetical protein
VRISPISWAFCSLAVPARWWRSRSPGGADLRQAGGGWPGRLARDTLAIQEPGHLLAADACRAGDAAGAVALTVEGQHSCS